VKISVIIPIYKVEQYLVKCLDSICNQTYKNLEIIGVDDGSPDNCGKILDEYAQKDKRIVAVHKQNGGLASARNAGIDIATGQYLGFVDSDDWIEPNMYEVLLNAIEKHNADMASCFVYRNYPDGQQTKSQIQFREITAGENNLIFNSWQEMFIGYLDRSVRDTGYSVPHLYHRNIFSDLRFPQNVRVYEDTWFLLWRMQRCKRQVIINEAYYHYYQSPTSLLRSEFGLHKLEIYKVFDYWLDVSNENGKIFDTLLRYNIVWQIVGFWFSKGAICKEHVDAIFKLLKKTYRFESDEESEIAGMMKILQEILDDIALKYIQYLPYFIVNMANIIVETIKERKEFSAFENINDILQKVKLQYPQLFSQQNLQTAGNGKKIAENWDGKIVYPSYSLHKTDENIVPVVLSTDENYAPFCAVTIKSMLEHANPHKKYNIYVFSRGLPYEKLSLLKNQTAQFPNTELEIVNVADAFESIPICRESKNYLSIDCWSRLLIPYLFKEYSKVVYLDVDTLIIGDISHMFEYDVSGYMLAAVDEFCAEWGSKIEHINKYSCVFSHNLIKKEKYFNSGILLLNTDEFRKNISDVDLFRYAIGFSYDYQPQTCDQDVLNILCADKWKILPAIYNFPARPSQVFPMKYKVLHFPGKNKPWRNDRNDIIAYIYKQYLSEILAD